MPQQALAADEVIEMVKSYLKQTLAAMQHQRQLTRANQIVKSYHRGSELLNYNFFTRNVHNSVSIEPTNATPMKASFEPITRVRVYRSIAVLCIILIVRTGYIAATHFHPNELSTVDRTCSTCALVHAGVVPIQLGPQIPIFDRPQLVESSHETSHSLLLVSAHFIRPPPLA